MTELSFLLELLLNHKLPKKTKDTIKFRIDEIQTSIPTNNRPIRTTGIQQAPSMQKAIEELEAEKFQKPPNPINIDGYANTPQAAQALLKRQELINNALQGKEEKGRTSPRKY